MIKLSGKLKIYFMTACLLSVIAAVLGVLMLLFFYDKNEHYFASGFLGSFTTAFSVISFLWFMSSFFFIPKNTLNGTAPITLPVLPVSGLLAAVNLISGIFFLVAANANVNIGPITQLLSPLARISPVIVNICGILFVLSALYPVLNCFSKNDGGSGDLHALSGFTLPLAAVMMIASTYFDTSVAMNSPFKIRLHLSLIAFMLYMLYELRAILGKAKPRAYLAFGMTAMFLLFSNSAPFIVAFIAGPVRNCPSYLIYSIISLAMSLYIGVRLYVFVSARVLTERIYEQTEAFPPEDEVTSDGEKEGE